MKANYFRFWLGQVLLGLVIGCIALLDPFGLSSSSDAASSQWINRIAASSYPDTGQQQVVVLLIDDAYLMRNATFWPLPYAQQSQLFKRLLAYKPRAVFVDLMYSHDHSPNDADNGSQLLVNVFERYREQGIPLLLANTGDMRGIEGQANALAPLDRMTRRALVKWSDVGDRYPLAMETSQGVIETPALGLYREYCRDRDCAGLPVDAAEAEQRPPIALRWGRTLSPQQSLATSVASCSVAADAWYAQLWQAIFWKLGDSGQATCPYTLTLKASALEANSPEDRALLRQMLSDKLVLVGAQITSAGDLTQTPVHGLLAGVYLHAMALDNLVTYHDAYQRDPQSYSRLSISWLDLVQLGFVIVIVGLRAWYQRRRHRRARTWRAPLLWWAVVQAALAVMCWGLWKSNISPANVLAIAVLSLSIIAEPIGLFFRRRWRSLLRGFARRRRARISLLEGTQG
jgi:CHASE2 domain-containing sensor protein